MNTVTSQTTPKSPRVWLDGALRDADTATVPVFDHGLLYGDGVFEGIRITGARVFRLERHLERLSRSARAIGLDLPFTSDGIAAIVCETAAAYDRDEAYVRLIVTRGSGALSLDPTICDEPRLICIVAGIRMFSEKQRQAGLRLLTASLRRPAADMLDPQVKSLNYLNNVMAKRQARLAGYDDALILNHAGRVAEARLAELQDAGVTPRSRREARAQGLEELRDRLLVAQLGEGPAAVVDAVDLAQGHELLHEGANGLGLDQGRGDPLVLDDRRSHVALHRRPVAGGPAQLGPCYSVSHISRSVGSPCGRLRLPFPGSGRARRACS